MFQYNVELDIYNDYRNGLDSLQDNISRLDKEIKKVMNDLMDFISNISDWNKYLKVVEGNCEVLVLNEIDRLTKDKNDDVTPCNKEY
jgi:hypothetical protein